MSVALVTGGSRGIGRAICEALAAKGYDVATCFSGDASSAMETVESCEAMGVKARAYKADVSNPDDVTNLFNQVKDEMGSVEVLVNNAGITRDGLLVRMPMEDFQKVMDINVNGTFLCTQAAVKSMMRAKSGCIINITSVVGITGNAGQANYCASKAAIIGFTKAVAKEYGTKGIRVNAVAPGFIQTSMTEKLSEDVKELYKSQIPVKRFGKVDDVASVVAFLASDDAAYITGQVLSVDGGLHM